MWNPCEVDFWEFLLWQVLAAEFVKFWKVSSTVILHSTWSSELTFENFYRGGYWRRLARPTLEKDFSKVSSEVVWQTTSGSGFLKSQLRRTSSSEVVWQTTSGKDFSKVSSKVVWHTTFRTSCSELTVRNFYVGGSLRVPRWEEISGESATHLFFIAHRAASWLLRICMLEMACASNTGKICLKSQLRSCIEHRAASSLFRILYLSKFLFLC